MSGNKKHRTIHAYLRYLKGELSGKERHALERDLEADPFEKEAMEGFELIAPGELEEDLLSLHDRLRKRHQRRRRVALYSIAASVASLLVVGTIFFNIYDFNPEAGQETVPEEKSILMEDSPKRSEPSVAEVTDPAEKQQVAGERDAKGPGAIKKMAAPTDKQEVVVPVQNFEMAAMEEADEVVIEEAEVAALQIADEEGPEIAEEIAPVPETDAVVAVEAAPTRRQKRAMSKARTVPSYTSQVSGVVVSAEDMEPLPDASLLVKGSSSDYVTDMQGRFTLPSGEETTTTIIASYVGMVTDEYQLAGGEDNRVVMQPDLATLNEVVVVGYEPPGETYPTSAVQRVKMEQQEDYATKSVAEPAAGYEAFKMYMEENIRFPAGDTISKREVVVLKFTVTPDGNISNIKSLRSPGDEFTEEAIRLLKEGPRWKPALGENGPTHDVVRMRIVFKKQ
jgi:hypothetical protein